MNKKMFVFDADGTILTDKNIILPQTLYALQKAKSQGHIIVIASGRPLLFIKKINDIKIFHYLICNNGSYYLNQSTGKKHNNNFVSKNIVNKIIKMSIKNKTVLFLNDTNNFVASIFSDDLNIKQTILSQWNNVKIVDINDIFEFVNENFITQSTILSTFKKIKILKKELLKHKNEIEIRIVDNKYLDINPKNSSKYSAILEISKKINVLNKNIFAFGDSENDLEMISNSGVGIAMGNALNEVKKVANEVIGDNNSFSLANKILEIIKVKHDWNK